MYSRIAVVSLLLSLSASVHAAVPAPLSAVLAQYGCSYIADDADVLRHRDRWWVSLKPFTGGDGDFTFYCQVAADPLSFRLMVVVGGENNLWRDCDPVVQSWRDSPPWFPYGLAVDNASPHYARQTDLGRWWLVSSSSNANVTYGPVGVKVPEPIIDTVGSSGAGALYACYARQWYQIGLD